MNWRTDALPSRPEENLGTLFLNPDGTVARQVEPVTARIDTASCTLVVDGLVPEEHFIPAIAPVAPLGNYHVQELNIYFGNLRHNVARRVRAYYEEGRADVSRPHAGLPQSGNEGDCLKCTEGREVHLPAPLCR